MQTPTQYRMLYLLAFLYAHQGQKVIVFANTCETVNFLTQICKTQDWDKCVNRKGNHEKKEQEEATSSKQEIVDFTQPSNLPDIGKVEEEKVKQGLFDGQVFKLHGDMDHADRKVNFFGFDKAKDQSLLICTDVASRGLDFKRVDWVLQWDLSS